MGTELTVIRQPARDENTPRDSVRHFIGTADRQPSAIDRRHPLRKTMSVPGT